MAGALTVQNIGTEIRFVGLKRSGNHAIVNWIVRQSKGPILHFNDVRPDEPYHPSRLVNGAWAEALAVDTTIYSIEDTALAVVADAHSYPRRDVYPDLRCDRRIDVLLLRDPFNLFASRFRRGEPWGRKALYVNGMSTPQLWVSYALEFLGQSRWLDPRCIRINYNQWCKSLEYRRELARVLDLEFTDEGFNAVTNFGGGSSFESTNMDGKADLMKTDQRWRTFVDDPRFLQLFEDPLLLDLAQEIFDLDEETAAMVNERLRPRTRKVSAARRRWATAVWQRVIARLRRSSVMRRLHRSFTSQWRERRMPIRR